MVDVVFEELARWLKTRRCLVGFDLDGTLVPLQRDPEAVHLSKQARAELETLARRHECAIITGRGLSDVARRAGLAGYHLIANHGAQLRKKEGAEWAWRSEAWESWRNGTPEPFRDLFEAHGGWLEDKVQTMSIHFRGAKDELWWEREAGVALLERVRGVAELMPGAMVWNVTPVGAPDKGSAAAKLCRELGLEAVVFFGDEATDENVFRLTEVPVLGVKVGLGETAAAYRVDSPSAVLTLVGRLLSL